MTGPAPQRQASLAGLADTLGRGDDWRVFDGFLDEHGVAIQARLSNVALARLGDLRNYGWLSHAEGLLRPRLDRFSSLPALVGAYARLGREARRQGDAATWERVRSWHIDNASRRPAIGRALLKVGAPPGSPPTARVLESGEGNLCAFRHEAGGAAVVEKLVETGSPEADIFAAFADGRLRLPEGEALQIALPMLVVREPGYTSLS